MLNDLPLSLPNLFNPAPNILTSGMPSDQDLQDVARKGVKTIINLCPVGETPATEADTVNRLGMTYVNIPIQGAPDLNPENARQLAEAMVDLDNHPVLVHCRSANRVGALLALKAFWQDGLSPQDALQLGRSAGLMNLEAGVMQIMQNG